MRRPLVVASLVLLLTISAWAGILLSTAPSSGMRPSSTVLTVAPDTAPTFPTAIHHVFVVMLENEKQSSVLANGPFEKNLTKTYASASHYYAVCHPSAPNYLGITSGAPWQCGSDSYKTHTTENLGDLAQKAGLTWDGFEESMPTACDTTDSYPYAVKHNPLVYYPDIVGNKTECKAHDVPLTNWTSDVANGTVPNLGIITPNLKDDGHDTGVAYADSWLKGWLSPLLNDSFYQSSVFFVVYDESVNDNTGYNGTSGGNVYLSAVSTYAKAGYTLTTNASHYNLLTTIEWLLGLGSTGQNDSMTKWPPMKSLFNFTSSTASLSATVSATPTSGVAPLNVSFTGSASGGTSPYTYAWSFGDTKSSTSKSPTHSYSTVGNYTATLTVTDSAKHTATSSVKVAVTKTVTALSVKVSGKPTSGIAPLLVAFTSTVSGGTTPYNYSWTFGGSLISYLSGPSHTFLFSGNYTAKLTVTDAAMKTASASVKIAVTKAGGVPFVAQASTGPASGMVPLATNFSATAQGGTPPFTYAWNFGDGTSSTQAAPSHTYNHAGTYEAVLNVTDAGGVVATSNVSVLVSPAVAGVASTLLGGSLIAATPGSFWSIDAQTSCSTCISSNASVTRYLASTPFTWVRYGQGIDACNISADRSYSSNGAASSGCGFNLTALKTWCYSTTPHCHVVLGLPGENNNSKEDAAIAKWIVSTVGLQPDYWAIGNEPTGWTHYGIPWTSWRSTDASTPTPLAYAFDVKAAIAAVKAVDPAGKFIGVEAACSCNTAWFQDVAKIDGASVAAFAFHEYPSTAASGTSTVSLAQFYAPLSGASNISGALKSVRSAIQGSCGSCANLPLFINEYNAGPGWAPSNYGGTYANAVFLAASVAQALVDNVSQLTLFNLESGSSSTYGYALLNSHGVPGPTGTLYSAILDHLAGGDVYDAGVATTVPNVWAVLTTNATTESLLVVNANLTQALALGLGSTGLGGVHGSVYQWSPSLSAPKVTTGTLAAAFSVPAQGILLIDVSRSLLPAVPVASPAPTVSGSPVVPLTLNEVVVGSAAVAIGVTVTVAATRRLSA